MSRPAGPPRPPAWMRALLALMLPRGERAPILAEMDELYRRRRARDGGLAAGLWYARHAAGFPARLALEGAGRATAGAWSGVAAGARDARHALRVLARHRGWAAASILTLGVGVGGIGTVLNAANWVLLRPVPGVHEPDDLMTLRLEVKGAGAGPAFPVSDPDLASIRARTPSLEGLAGSFDADLHVEPPGGGDPRRLPGAVVTPGYFDVLGVEAWRGRLPDPRPGPAEETGIVVSHRLWRDVLAGRIPDGDLSLRVNGRLLPVVGVAPPGFHGHELPGSVELWLQAGALGVARPELAPDALDRRGTAVWTGLVGRMAAGAGPAGVAGEAEAAMVRIREEHTAHSFLADFRWGAYEGVGLSPRVREPVRRTLLLLTGAGALLLLLAIANLGNLSLVHATTRDGETALHLALGASRAAALRRVLVEHALLGLGGTLSALLVAGLGTRLFRDASLSSLGASLQGMRMDGRVAVATAVIAVAASLVASLAPAAIAARGDLVGRLRGRRDAGPGVRRTQAGLVTLQVALSAALLVGAGLLARTVVNLRDVEPGFAPERAARFSLDPRLHGYDDARVSELVGRVVERLAREPGILAAGFVSPELVRGAYLTIALHRPGTVSREDVVIGAQFQATPGFAAAAGLDLVAGRWFDAGDTGPAEGEGEAVVVVGESMARSLWGEVAPAATVGRTVGTSVRSGAEARVIGVVRDVRVTGALDDSPPSVVFRPWGQGLAAGPVVGWVRSAGGPAAILPRLGAAIREAAPTLPVYDLRTGREQVDRRIVEQRVVARLALALAGVGLLLAGIGLHGVLGYAVTSRRREIGVRAALGARPRALVGALVARSLVLTAVGAGLGGALALPLVRVLRSRLFGLEPLDPPTLLAGAAALLVVAALAAWSPARRATRVSPVEVLSAE